MKTLDNHQAKINPRKIPEGKILSFLIKTYDIATPKINLMLGGIENVGWLVSSNDNLTPRFVLKIFNQNTDLEHLRKEIILYDELRKKDFLTPEIINGNNDHEINSIEFKSISYPAILMKYQEMTITTPATITNNQISKISNLVARLHFCTKEMKTLFKGTSGNKSKIVKTGIHGDLTLYHMPFIGNSEVYIYDFDRRKYGSIYEDLASLIITFYASGTVDNEKAKSLESYFVKTYFLSSYVSCKYDRAKLDLYKRARVKEVITYLKSVNVNSNGDSDSLKQKEDWIDRLSKLKI